MDMLYLFGYKLAELIKQNDAAGLGLLCLAIKDAGKASRQMSYQDFREVFNDHLPKRLERLKVANRDQVTREMLNLLHQKQSLFTMTAH